MAQGTWSNVITPQGTQSVFTPAGASSTLSGTSPTYVNSQGQTVVDTNAVPNAQFGGSIFNPKTGTYTAATKEQMAQQQAAPSVITPKDAISKITDIQIQAKQAGDEIKKAQEAQNQVTQQQQATTQQQSTAPQPTPQVKPLPEPLVKSFLNLNQGKPYTYATNPDGTFTYFDAQGNKLADNPFAPGKKPQETSGFGQVLIPQQTQQPQAIDQLAKGMTDLQAQSDLAYSDMKNQISGILNGSIPLTPSQQSLLNSTNAKFDDLAAQQKIANESLTGAVTLAGISSGRNRYAPEIESGNVYAAVTAGIKALKDIEVDRAMTVDQMNEAFQDKNIKNVLDAYDRFTKYTEQKQKAVEDLYTAVNNHEKDLRDFNYKVVQDTIKNTLESDKFTYQQKQDAITNALNRAKLSIEERKQTLAETNQKMIEKIWDKINNPTVLISKDSTGNPSEADQAKFLSQFPTSWQTQIKSLASYDIDPKSFPTAVRKGQEGQMMTRSQALSLAKQYDPTFNEMEYDARKAFLKSWNAGGINSVGQAANTALQHMNELSDVFNKIASSNDKGILSKTYNNLGAFIKENEANPDVAQFETIVNSVAGELAKIFKNGTNSSASPTELEQDEQRKVFNLSWGKEGLDGIIKSTANLMRDRLNTAQETYKSVMGKQPKTLLLPSAQKAIEALKSKGIDVDFSSLNPMSAVSDDELFNSAIGSTQTGTTSPEFWSGLMNQMNMINQFNQ